MRLIDADALKEQLCLWCVKGQIKFLQCHNQCGLIDLIDDQPTAYDVDKVVEEISGADCDRLFDLTDKVINIVRRGGIHE